MNYLSLETSKLLEKRGCVSESGMHWVYDWIMRHDTPKEYKWSVQYVIDPGNQINPPERYHAFIWDDICTKENAIKIWPFMTLNRIKELLEDKLMENDWEAELLKHLKGSK